MSDSPSSGSTSVLKYALLAFLILLLGLGLAVILGGDGEGPAPYEGFN